MSDFLTDEQKKKIDDAFKDWKPTNDSVNHPKHYNTGKIEVITAIDEWKLGFALGNTIKYIARAAHKGSELEDLKKARWYLNHRIEQLEVDVRSSVPVHYWLDTVTGSRNYQTACDQPAHGSWTKDWGAVTCNDCRKIRELQGAT